MSNDQRWIAQLKRRLAKDWRRTTLPAACIIIPLLLLTFVFSPTGCTSQSREAASARTRPPRIVRVQLLGNQEQVVIGATEAPMYYTNTDTTPRLLNLRSGVGFGVTYVQGGWKVGATPLGSGELTIIPNSLESFTLNGKRYRGQYQLVPTGPGKFDVINHVDIEDYLKGVLRSELFANWQDETYKAQAIIARTYALYEKAWNETTSTERRNFDLYCDQRSQVYGGIEAETSKAKMAVDETSGIVVAYGEPGQEHIFKAYFSSCCGGTTQSAPDAFGPKEQKIEPLTAQHVGPLCNASTRFNWGPVVVRKEELTRRFRAWGTKHNELLRNVGLVTRIDVQQRNEFGRPIMFQVTDDANKPYPLRSEQLRNAVNTEAIEGTTLASSYVNVITDSDTIRFVDGHGFGHGVGMCQWCAEARAKAGLRHEDIVLAAYPKSRLVRAY